MNTLIALLSIVSLAGLFLSLCPNVAPPSGLLGPPDQLGGSPVWHRVAQPRPRVN